MQSPVKMSFGGAVFSNLTLYTQNVSFHYQTLVAGQTYHVAVRATNNGAQRLNATASSDGVEVSYSPTCPFRQTVACPGLVKCAKDYLPSSIICSYPHYRK